MTSSVITLESTPTWAVAVVVFVLISISICIEHLLHLLAKYFNKNRRKYLIQALDKIKSELLQLGFISLLLTVGEKPIANICIPKSIGEIFLPCSDPSNDSPEEAKCEEQGMVSLLSRQGMKELQYLIFVLAFFHSLSCILTFGLGMAKMRKWESWEAETRTLEYQFSNGGSSLFIKHHLQGDILDSGVNTGFFAGRHVFFDSSMHLSPNLWVWILSMLFIFLNAHDFYNYLWLPFIPLLVSIITRMCLESQEKSQVVRGTFLVRPSDHFFWFGWPKLLLHLMHFILFQYKFGFRSCFHRKTEDIVMRLGMGVLVQVLCGYVTLPLYALVTQMGTSMKKVIFPEKVVEGLKRWRANARRNIALKNNYTSARPSLDNNTTSINTSPSFGASPSFNLNTSHCVKFDQPSSSEYLAVEVKDEGKANSANRETKDS
ncbi:hypothetical protein CXB51_022551 [Gossypium anomalum]|uniref:MLO-like protein n=1 Tax=Gossypium anomalum TaxID=47600 RepID=A0A8J5YJS7_9ROSI|nr:hypothetical protein CXB51_022551 [Gossypium anomalum]